jgi:hypothetical protein
MRKRNEQNDARGSRVSWCVLAFQYFRRSTLLAFKKQLCLPPTCTLHV